MSLTGLAFLLFFTGGIGLALVRGPIWGLWTYIAVFYLHPPSRWWGVGLPGIRWALLAAIVTLIAVMIHRSPDRDRPGFLSHGFAWLFVAYVAWMWIQAPWALSSVHMEGAILFTKYALLVFLIYATVRTPEQVRDTLIVHIAGCVYLGWLAYNAGGGGRLEGVGGPGINDANSMAMQLGTGVICGAALMLREKLPRFSLVLLCMPFILNGMVLGNSRGAFVGLFVAGLCLWVLKPDTVRAKFYAFATLGIFLFLLLAHELFWERIASLTAITDEQQELDNSSKIRVELAKAQLRMFADHPFGAGHKGTTELSRAYLDPKFLATDPYNPTAPAVRSSHNSFMSVLVDQGIVGVIILALIIAWTVKSTRKLSKAFADRPDLKLLLAATVGGLMVVTASGVFAPYLKAEVQYWFFGLLLSLEAIERSLSTVTEDEAIPGRSSRAQWSSRTRRQWAPAPRARHSRREGLRF